MQINQDIEKRTINTLFRRHTAKKQSIIFIICFASLIRILLSLLPAYRIDMAGYLAWSNYLAEHGTLGVYEKYHIVYAPAYLYLIMVSGKIKMLLDLTPEMHAFLIKLWAVLFDGFASVIIYKIAESLKREKEGIILAITYFLNPSIIMNSSVWGQFDSIPATIILYAIYLFEKKKRVLPILLYAVAILTKPQSGLLLPIIVFLYFRNFKVKDKMEWLYLLYNFVGCFMIYWIIVTPFYTPSIMLQVTVGEKVNIFKIIIDRFYWLIHLYLTSVEDYAYGTANAFNLWTLLKAQAPVLDSEKFMGMSYLLWGYLLSISTIVISLILAYKKVIGKVSIYYATFLLLFGLFFFSTRMHERYLVPAIIFVTICCIFEKKLYIPMIILSFCVAVNQWYIYNLSWKDIYWITNGDKLSMIFAYITCLMMIFCLIYAITNIGQNNEGTVRK